MERLARETTAAAIVRQLREAIADSTLAPGSRLNEVELAETFGVSRGPVREALHRLSQDGLVTSSAQRGLRVLDLTDETVRDIYLARIAIERAAAAEAVRKNGRSHYDTVGLAVEKMRNAEIADDRRALSAADLEFHRALVVTSGSQRLARLHDTILTETWMCLNAFEHEDAPRPRAEDHAAIAEALTAGDDQLTDRLLLEHLRGSLEEILQQRREQVEADGVGRAG